MIVLSILMPLLLGYALFSVFDDGGSSSSGETSDGTSDGLDATEYQRARYN